jgi:hypothetical protein
MSEIAEPTPERDSLSAMAELPPTDLVQEAWKRIDQTIREVATKRGLPDKDQDFFPFVSYLEAIGALKLSPEERDSIIELHNLRNLAVHPPDPQITITDALRYHDLANRLVSLIKERLAPPPE